MCVCRKREVSGGNKNKSLNTFKDGIPKRGRPKGGRNKASFSKEP